MCMWNQHCFIPWATNQHLLYWHFSVPVSCSNFCCFYTSLFLTSQTHLCQQQSYKSLLSNPCWRIPVKFLLLSPSIKKKWHFYSLINFLCTKNVPFLFHVYTWNISMWIFPELPFKSFSKSYCSFVTFSFWHCLEPAQFTVVGNLK